MNTRQAKKLEQIKRFRYIDDTFFSVALDKYKPGVELILQIVTGNQDMRVKTVHTQETVVNLYGKSVRFDIFAADKKTDTTARSNVKTEALPPSGQDAIALSWILGKLQKALIPQKCREIS
ncbi:MAG: hypothetical protein J6N22_05975 [Schwartzia sp.]|nr:hypothetical protein [Schwartzia sp. (in: firmicutes)]